LKRFKKVGMRMNKLETKGVSMLGLNIKGYLDMNGIKYSHISAKAGIPMNVLSPMLNSKRRIYADQYHDICEVLKVPMETFFRQQKSQ